MLSRQRGRLEWWALVEGCKGGVHSLAVGGQWKLKESRVGGEG